jgi:DNA repair exonuclease SbcCD ATPase subunit
VSHRLCPVCGAEMTDPVHCFECGHIERTREQIESDLRAFMKPTEQDLRSQLSTLQQRLAEVERERGWQHKERLRLDGLRADLVEQRDLAIKERDEAVEGYAQLKKQVGFIEKKVYEFSRESQAARGKLDGKRVDYWAREFRISVSGRYVHLAAVDAAVAAQRKDRGESTETAAISSALTPAAEGGDR